MKPSDLQKHQPELPIWQVMAELQALLRRQNRAILLAPPGAGKSSIVPLTLLDELWLAGRRILLLEPRRLAARNLAWRLAELSGQALGDLIGLRTRDETLVGPLTRIEVLTEALLTRRIQADPELPGVGLVIFDEFHERSAHADLGLALARDVQAGLREDLRLLLMSATLDESALASALDAGVVRSAGRSFPVELRYQPVPGRQRLEDAVAATVLATLRQESGSILVFLPGEAEIHRVAERLRAAASTAFSLHPLYGRLDRAAQQAAISPPAPGQRKVVLATAVAETSLTIAGVRVVIDSGLARDAVYNPNAGFGHLQTRRLSLDAADQRAGRAGRLEPGLCIRLWSVDEVLRPLREPEIRCADLSALALQVAAWGSAPAWLETPPAGPWQQALDLLGELGLLDAQGRITRAGRRVSAWGCHPRVGRLLLAGEASDSMGMACDLAALLEADSRALRETDLHLRWLAWRHGGETARRNPGLDRDARRWRRRCGVGDQHQEVDPGRLLAAAFPDRIAQQRGRPGAYLLANGRGAQLAPDDPLLGQPYLVVAQLDGREQGRVRLAARYALADLREQFAAQLESSTVIEFNPRSGLVEARQLTGYRSLILAEQNLPQPDPLALGQALLQGVAQRGLAALPWDGEAALLRGRLRHLHALDARWPDCSDAALEQELEDWLGPRLCGLRKWTQIDSALLARALLNRVDGALRGQLDALAPVSLKLPSGQHRKLDYSAPEGPALSIRMQDMFGLDATPQVAGKPVLLHLLSPAGRPLAVTRDLASFWRNAYPEVRKQMRGRYPKHAWPEQPWVGAGRR